MLRYIKTYNPYGYILYRLYIDCEPRLTYLKTRIAGDQKPLVLFGRCFTLPETSQNAVKLDGGKMNLLGNPAFRCELLVSGMFFLCYLVGFFHPWAHVFMDNLRNLHIPFLEYVAI